MAGLTVGVACETAPGERRVAMTPETCKKLVARGARVLLQRDAGRQAAFSDQAYADAGANIVDSAEDVLTAADLVLCVQPPDAAAIASLKEGATLVGSLAPQADAGRGDQLDGNRPSESRVGGFVNLAHTSRAESLDDAVGTDVIAEPEPIDVIRTAVEQLAGRGRDDRPGGMTSGIQQA